MSYKKGKPPIVEHAIGGLRTTGRTEGTTDYGGAFSSTTEQLVNEVEVIEETTACPKGEQRSRLLKP